MAVAVAERLGGGQIEKPGLGIEIGGVGMNGQYLGNEQLMGAQLADLFNPAFQVYGRLGDERRRG